MHISRMVQSPIRPMIPKLLPVQQQVRTTQQKASPPQTEAPSMLKKVYEFFSPPPIDHQAALARLQAHPKTLPEKEALAALKKDIELITPQFLRETKKHGYPDFDKGTYIRDSFSNYSLSPYFRIEEGTHYKIISELETLLRFQGWKVMHVQHNDRTFDSERLWLTYMLNSIIIIPTQENRLLMVDPDFPRNFKKEQDPPLLIYTQTELKEKLPKLKGLDLEFYTNLSTHRATQYKWPDIDLGKYNPGLTDTRPITH